jgi:tetratricopeptide (TPR) repeat protein
MNMERLSGAPRLSHTPNILLTAVVLVVASSGCTEVRGRKMLQDANELYKKGRYQEAVALFEAAEPLVPQLPVLWLNKGYTCRQLLTPGAAPTAETRRWATCALDAFTKLKEIAPHDPRGEQLYVQTLFDTNDFATLESMFLAQSRDVQGRGGFDQDAATGLQQVYFKWGKWAQALFWARKSAEVQSGDADAQYRLGAFIWQLLSSRGGGADMTAFDPRAAPNTNPGTATPDPAPKPPTPAIGDINGGLRIELADEGIRYLEKALALRPRHQEAMIYLNLLYRQRSVAFFAEPAKWQAAVDKANEWQKRGLAAHDGASPKL